MKPFLFCLLFLALCAQNASPLRARESSEPESRNPGHLVFKMMIVNPSSEYEQTYPMKAYLPEEVKPEHILDLAGLRIGFDPESQAYFLTEDLLLAPGEAVVKSVQIRDVWVIPETKLVQYTRETNELYGKLQSTAQSKKAQLLLTHVETRALQITESQKINTLTPNEHIQLFKDNKQKLREMQMDMLMLRRLVISEGGDTSGLLPLEELEEVSVHQLPAAVNEMALYEDTFEESGSGSGWMVWRLIFALLAFAGAGSLIFFGVLQHRDRKLPVKGPVVQDHEDTISHKAA